VIQEEGKNFKLTHADFDPPAKKTRHKG
jgi:hypothetical protein